MEYYKSTCANPTCLKTYTWVGFKTGIGKTPEQLEQMRRDETVCRYCGQETLKTTLDHETPYSRSIDAALGNIVGAMASGSLLAKAESGDDYDPCTGCSGLVRDCSKCVLSEPHDKFRDMKKLLVEMDQQRCAAEDIVRKVRKLNQERPGSWTWLGDGTDDLSSMGDEMAVVIMAGDLRALLRARQDDPKRVDRAVAVLGRLWIEICEWTIRDIVRAILEAADKEGPT